MIMEKNYLWHFAVDSKFGYLFRDFFLFLKGVSLK